MQQKVIKIFLASSIDEFKHERDELGRFIGGINNRYFERGLYCKLEMCEDGDQAMSRTARKQDEYNKLIEDADAVFVLFFRKAGKYTVEELETARTCFLKNGSPKVYTYFKDFDEANLTGGAREVYDLITKEYQHFFSIFENIAAVKLNILRVMFDITAEESLKVEIREDEICMGNGTVMSADELDYIKNSRAITELKAKIA